MPDASPRGEMPFLDHLEELRWRILWSLLAIAVGTAIGWLLVDRIDVITLLKRPIAPFLPDGRLMFTSPTEPFLLTLKVSFAVGCVLASPAVIYQLWAFLAPALYPREKRLIIPALAVGVVLFAAGAVAAYLWALPAALEVLLSFTRGDLAPIITIDRYFGFAIPFILAFGVITELPLVVAILASLGLVTPQFLARHRRYAIVVGAVVAALLTPPDALSMVMMLVPILLLYEISIWCAWVASRRRARRLAAETAASATGGAAVLLALALAGALSAQQPPGPAAGRTLDTATARKLGLPTGPVRSFPPSDPVMDSLLKLQGFRITRYVADTLTVLGESQTMVLRGEAFVEREGTKIEADSIRYQEAACRLDAEGSPRLFDQGTVLVGEGMRYDTCVRRGTVRDARTDFQQGGVTWLMKGQMAVDSGSTRVYAARADITSDPQPVPDYHFAVGRVKWLNKTTMVARPVVLYVRDVPVMWLPFIFNDIRSGRRSGILVPRFGLNDLVRPTRTYSRHITDFGYYFALNDYVDLLVSGSWYAGRTLSFSGQSRYRWLNRFMSGGFSYTRTQELDLGDNASHIRWDHAQTFSSKTRFNASVDYSTSARVLARNSLDPFQATATLGSRATFEKRLSWGTLTIGGSRSQELSNDRVTQTFPDIRLTPSPVNITPTISWSPGFTFTNVQTFHNPVGTLVVPGDTVDLFFTDRATSLGVQTPLRVGRWTWGNAVSVRDAVSNRRQEFVIPDDAAPGGVRRVLYGQTFETEVDWQTSINLPPLFTGTWNLQPGIAIVNTTSGPFMIRNQFTGGEFVRQGKRLAFNASVSPTFFAFLPGVGPLARIRHSISPGLSYQYAPGDSVPAAYTRAIDPTGTQLNSKIDPRQTFTLSLSQNFEAKLRPAPGDTAVEGRKIRLLGITTSGISYNFEQAKQPGRTGWQTPSLTNTISSDLVRGFRVSLTHDLWDGQVGLDTTRFDPFLQSVSLSPFTITPATLRGLAALFGLGGRARAPAGGEGDTTAAGGATLGGTQIGPKADPLNPYGSAGAGEQSRAFSLTVGYSANRSRGDTSAAQANESGRRVMRLDLAFAPTRRWTASWHTSYDLGTQQAAEHFVRFERDMNRWRASFVVSKSANGNFAFSVNVSLSDQPDIKFDYDQRTLTRP